MTSRRSFLVRFTMAAGAVSVLRPFDIFAGIGTKLPVLASTNVLTILHTANLNGQGVALGSGDEMASIGGLQNISQKIADIKKEAASVFVIDAGNIAGHRQTREERLNFYKSVARTGYDIIVPGRTDLAGGSDSLMALVKESNLNLISQVFPLPIGSVVLPYSVIKKGKTKIGIINAGLHALKSIQKTSTSAATVAINQTAHLLRSSMSCKLIICVVQSSSRKCEKLASLSTGIDVMISAADKTSLHNTHIVRNQSNHEVMISYAGAKGAMMSRMDFTFNEKGEKIHVASRAVFTSAKEESYTSILKRYTMYTA